MTKVLHVISSTRGEESSTIKLGNAIIEKIKTGDPAATVKELNLSITPFPHLDQLQINSFFTPEDLRTPEQVEAVKRSNDAVAELQDADIIIIGAPMYNFSISSGLKAYFDHIARAKLTFRYSEGGAEGLLKNKKAYIAFSSAGVFDNEHMKVYDFAVPYIKHFLGFIGITDVITFRVEGTAIPGLQETAMEKALTGLAV